MTAPWTEDRIAALLDGAIEDPAEADALRQVIAADPAAQAVAVRIELTNRLMREAFTVEPGDPASERLARAILDVADTAEPATGSVVPFRSRRASGIWLPRLAAAGLVLGAGLGAALWLAGDGETMVLALGEVPSDGTLHHALETAPGGTADKSGVMPMLTFIDGAGRPCREFELTHRGERRVDGGIACRQPDGLWQVEALADASAETGQAGPAATPGAGFVPAAGSDGDVLDAALDSLGAGPALAPSEEARLIASGWQTRD